MLRVTTKAVLVISVGVCALLFAQSESVRAQEKKTTKQIMSAGHDKTDGLYAKVQAAVKAKKWEDAAEPAKTLAANGALFPKATPPKGEQKSWDELSAKYAAGTKALAEAVEKKDEDAAAKAIGEIGGARGQNCMACHTKHRGK